MGIMDMFRSSTPPAQTTGPAAASTTPGNVPPNPSTVTAPGDGITPIDPTTGKPVVAANTDPNKVVSPLDTFTDLWKIEAPKPGAKDPNAPMFNVDPAKLMEAAGKIDFSTAMTPERLAAITAGGEGAAKAAAEMSQQMAVIAITQSATTTASLVEAAVKKARTDFQAEIPALVKSASLRDATFTENPALNHPAAQPIVTALQSQLQVKHPTATATELRAMVSAYLDGLGKVAAGPATEAVAAKAKKGEQDWSTFLE